MSWKIFFIGCALVATASASFNGGCSCSCRNYKFVQFRRPSFFSIYESSSPNPSPPCETIYSPQEHFSNSPLDGVYPMESLPKLEPIVSRYLTPYVEPKQMPCHKCMCSKPSSSHRLVASMPRYCKRRYCNDQMMEALPMRPPSASYGQCSSCCDQYDECGQCSQCSMCGQCENCEQYEPHGCSSMIFRPPCALPMSLPPSCIC